MCMDPVRARVSYKEAELIKRINIATDNSDIDECKRLYHKINRKGARAFSPGFNWYGYQKTLVEYVYKIPKKGLKHSFWNYHFIANGSAAFCTDKPSIYVIALCWAFNTVDKLNRKQLRELRKIHSLGENIMTSKFGHKKWISLGKDINTYIKTFNLQKR